MIFLTLTLIESVYTLIRMVVVQSGIEKSAICSRRVSFGSDADAHEQFPKG